MEDYRTDRRRGVTEAGQPRDEDLAEFAWRWHAVHTAESPPNTRTDYASTIRNGITRPGTILTGATVGSVTPLVVKGWLNGLSTPWTDSKGRAHPGYGPSQRIKAFRILSLIMKAAEGERLRAANTNPCDGITPVGKGVRAAARREHYYLYVSEVARIIAAADYIPQRGHEDWGLFFEVAAFSGMRPQEVRALYPQQVHADAGFILVDAAISDGSKKVDMSRESTKSGQRRLAYLPAPVLTRLTARITERGLAPTQLVFPGEDGVSFMWSSSYNAQGWIPMCGVAGVEPDPTSLLRGRRGRPIPYDLRAALISHLRSAGVPHVDVGAQVGHQDEATSDLYTVVQSAGLEDQIAVAARRATNLTRAAVIDFLYAEAQATL